MEERSTGELPQEAPERKVAVELSGVTKRFGEFVAVDELTLEICEGEFFSLLEPSGCGKTTTLRLIAGFEKCKPNALSTVVLIATMILIFDGSRIFMR